MSYGFWVSLFVATLGISQFLEGTLILLALLFAFLVVGGFFAIVFAVCAVVSIVQVLSGGDDAYPVLPGYEEALRLDVPLQAGQDEPGPCPLCKSLPPNPRPYGPTCTYHRDQLRVITSQGLSGTYSSHQAPLSTADVWMSSSQDDKVLGNHKAAEDSQRVTQGTFNRHSTHLPAWVHIGLTSSSKDIIPLPNEVSESFSPGTINAKNYKADKRAQLESIRTSDPWRSQYLTVALGRKSFDPGKPGAIDGSQAIEPWRLVSEHNTAPSSLQSYDDHGVQNPTRNGPRGDEAQQDHLSTLRNEPERFPESPSASFSATSGSDQSDSDTPPTSISNASSSPTLEMSELALDGIGAQDEDHNTAPRVEQKSKSLIDDPVQDVTSPTSGSEASVSPLPYKCLQCNLFFASHGKLK
ncbi:hypothetical protein EK21DRAFT_114291 [Setomelanomma holmii]|uniref:Uncharacterized protein n=1 Tax=Setomelanomma holmii TaxID=210430 RepID=A0A9P4H5J0_9PLEO|nr:hypothetical protein EK21DRAFT_114291 [Setomelanomma holmii]